MPREARSRAAKPRETKRSQPLPKAAFHRTSMYLVGSFLLVLPRIEPMPELEKNAKAGKKAMNFRGLTRAPSKGHFTEQAEILLNNPVPVSLLSGDRKPQIRFLGNHHSGSGNLYHKSFRM